MLPIRTTNFSQIQISSDLFDKDKKGEQMEGMCEWIAFRKRNGKRIFIFAVTTGMFERYSHDEDDQYFAFLQMEAERFERFLKEGGPFFMDSGVIGELFYYYKSRGEWKLAAALVEFALEVYPYHSEFYYYQAQVTLKKRDPVKAFQWVQKAIEMNPIQPAYWLLAIESLLWSRQKKKALAYVKYGEKEVDEKKRKEFFWRVGLLLQRHHLYNQAQIYLLKAFHLDPGNPDLVYDLCDLYEKKGKLQRAIAVIERYLKSNPEDADLWYDLGYYYEQIGWYDHALKAYRFASLLDPKFDEAWLRQGECYFQLGDYDRVLNLLETFQETHKKKPSSFYELYGKTYYALGKYEQAIQCFHRALKQSDRKRKELIIGIARAYIAQKNYEQALEFLAMPVESEEEDSWETLELLFQMSLELKDSGKRLNHDLHHLLQLSLDEAKWSYWIHKLFLQQNVSEAIQLIEEILPYFEFKSALLLYQKAAYLLYTNQLQKGYETLENALLLNFAKRHALFHFVPSLQKEALVKEIMEIYRTKARL